MLKVTCSQFATRPEGARRPREAQQQRSLPRHPHRTGILQRQKNTPEFRWRKDTEKGA